MFYSWNKSILKHISKLYHGLVLLLHRNEIIMIFNPDLNVRGMKWKKDGGRRVENGWTYRCVDRVITTLVHIAALVVFWFHNGHVRPIHYAYHSGRSLRGFLDFMAVKLGGICNLFLTRLGPSDILVTVSVKIVADIPHRPTDQCAWYMLSVCHYRVGCTGTKIPTLLLFMPFLTFFLFSHFLGYILGIQNFWHFFFQI